MRYTVIYIKFSISNYAKFTLLKKKIAVSLKVTMASQKLKKYYI